MAVWVLGDYFSVTWALVIGAILIFLVYDWWCHQYFQRAGIPVVPYYPIVGNAIDWMKKGQNLYAEECVKKYGKVVGIYRFQYPILYVSDVKLLKKILVTEFNKFPEHYEPPAIGFPLDSTMLYMKGQRWREIRAVISPSFTASKLRQMVPAINDCCDPLLENLQKAQDTNQPIYCKKTFLGYFVQVIAGVILGLDIPCQKDLDHPFVKHCEHPFNPTIMTVIPILFPSLAPIFKLLGANIFSTEAINYFTKSIQQATAGEGLILRRVDESGFKYTTMLEMYARSTEFPGQLKKQVDVAKDSANQPKKMSYKEFLAVNVLLLAGGNEATSTFLVCTAYLLALHPEIQDKLIAEMDEIAPNPGDITYDAMAKLTYTEMVLMESLRFLPPEISTDRICNETVTYGNYTFKNRMHLHIPFYPIHHDEEVWPDPEKFDPERFSPENKDKINPIGFIVFGVGPRNCIALKFTLLIGKIFLTRVLHKYRFQACPQTPIPLKFGKMTMLEPKDVFVGVGPRTTG